LNLGSSSEAFIGCSLFWLGVDAASVINSNLDSYFQALRCFYSRKSMSNR
jgi:hypothetical protein